MSDVYHVYELRRKKRNDEAYACAYWLYDKNPDDDEIKKAFAWTLIDQCNKFLNLNKKEEVHPYLNGLKNLRFDVQDDFTKTIKKQITRIVTKMDPYSAQIEEAEKLSKLGKTKKALITFYSLLKKNQLSENHHESFGWAIYRCLKNEKLTSLEVRRLLRDYMSLKNERPSLLHSMILNFAIQFSRSNKDFKFLNFLKLWGIDNFREKDLVDGESKQNKKIPSLISRVCKELVELNIPFDLKELFLRINDQTELKPKENVSLTEFLDFFRKPFFWKLYNSNKENNKQLFHSLLDNYLTRYSGFGGSYWHSEILSLVSRLLTESEGEKFLWFFKKWNPKYLRPEDWRETENGKETYRPLGITVLKRSFEVLKSDQIVQDIGWLIEIYNVAINHLSNDEWLKRERALLLIRNEDFEIAIKEFKSLVLELGDKYYIWQEFSKCFESNNEMKIAMLSKALSIESNEDFLGDLHLELAECLIEEKLFENAFLELLVYRNHREIKGWSLSKKYEYLYTFIESIETVKKNNDKFYKKYFPKAEKYAYSDIDWKEFVLIDIWKNNQGKKRFTFTNVEEMEIIVSKKRFPKVEKLKKGNVCKFKVYQLTKKIKVKTIRYGRETLVTKSKLINFPLIMKISNKEPWSALNETVAAVNYINKEREIVHAVTKDHQNIFFKQTNKQFEKGEFIRANFFYKQKKGHDKKLYVDNVRKVSKQDVLSLFEKKLAVVDDVNSKKKLYHYVIDRELNGIIRYSNSKPRPDVGDFIEVVFTKRRDNENKLRIDVLEVVETSATNESLKRNVSGFLEVKFKKLKNITLSYEDFIEIYPDSNKKPDFAFLDDYYVHRNILDKYKIYKDCKVNSTIVYTGDRWKVIKIEPLNK